MDKGVCPYCGKEFEVGKGDYGYGMLCPHCKRKIDVFPDPVWIETSWGTLGVSKHFLSDVIGGLNK
jgi:hypothetical protein